MMDKAQAAVLDNLGYTIQAVPGLRRQPRMDFRHPDGHVMVNLPADPYHLERFLRRGFIPMNSVAVKKPVMVAKPENAGDAQPIPVTEQANSDIPEARPDPPQEGFRCDKCGRVLSTKGALAGHSRKHLKE